MAKNVSNDTVSYIRITRTGGSAKWQFVDLKTGPCFQIR